MKILLIDIDSTIPNLALKKIEKYHLDKKDEVIWHNRLLYGQVDKTYVSCIFDWNKYKIEQFSKAEKGGSGYSLNINLPEEIENIKPRINLGFTTRGCIRKCQFCIVPKKEGKIIVVGDLLDLWDRKSKIVTILDNNILALPEHFSMVCKQAKENNLTLDFNQGLDHRLLTQDSVDLLKSIKTTNIRFAFDHPSYQPSVEKAISLLGNTRAMWYVLVGFNTTFEEDLERVNFLHNVKQRAYIMRYKTCMKDKKYIALARWVNSPYWRNAMTFNDFCKRNNYNFI